MDKIVNLLYNNILSPPHVSVVTSVYNRKELLLRAMESIRQQTIKDIEYIIVNDGSTEDLDGIVLKYMESVHFPVLYIKKNNGGVHTGRNLAISEARGKYLLILDSDDEFVPDAIETFLNAWNQIPAESKETYREVVALCKNQYGKQIGGSYPADINTLPIKKVERIRKKLTAEHTALNRTDILKQNPWPEPEGVTFVAESIIWRLLDTKYNKWFINDCLRIYYDDTSDSISKLYRVKTIQNSINDLFRHQYLANNWPIYRLSFFERCKEVLIYLVFYHNLKCRKVFPKYMWAKNGLSGVENRCLKIVFFIPAWIIWIVIRNRFQ